MHFHLPQKHPRNARGDIEHQECERVVLNSYKILSFQVETLNPCHIFLGVFVAENLSKATVLRMHVTRASVLRQNAFGQSFHNHTSV